MNAMIFHRKQTILLLFLVFIIFIAGSLTGQSNEAIDLDLSIDARECYTGESLTLQALVSGTDEVEIRDLPEPPWGTITYLGGQRRNSQSITSINGKFTRVEEKGFLMSFQITPGRTGVFTVPEIRFKAGGQVLSSRSFTITAKAPEKSDDYAMEVSTGYTSLYPGQEFILDVRWYYKKGARSLRLNLPILDECEYLGQLPVRGRTYEIVLNNMSVQATGEEGFSESFGEKATYLAFSLILKAKTTGQFDLSESTSRFDGVTGTETVRDFFGQKQIQEKYSTLVVQASGETLTVQSLPSPPPGKRITKGTTIIGPAGVSAELSKTEISIGEPVTLTLTFSGASNSDFSILPLNEQPALQKDFSIPPERSPGKNEGEERIFVQTIRLKNPEPVEFPALMFPLFNADTGQWETIRSNPVPITVLSTVVADSGDLELFEDSGPVIRDLERNKSGLEASLSGPSLLLKKQPGNYPWIPPALFYILLAVPALTWLFLFLNKKHFFNRKMNGSSDFKRFLKTWDRNQGALNEYETAFRHWMKIESGNRTRGIYGGEDVLETSPEGMEAYLLIKTILDKELYSSERGNGGEFPKETRRALLEKGKILLKEILK